MRWYDAWWTPRAKQGVKWFVLGQYLQHQAIPPEAMLDRINRYGQTLDSALRKFAAEPLGVVGNLIMWPALDPSLVPAATP